ncbi:hypothetical protein C8J56DRAFT_821029 [Mycena floridula]|nr:hypothetical protein C8J56DRAFT_821029 [Mycena floridula]
MFDGDELGIVYHIETAQQFWSELEDILALPRQTPTLQQLDSTLKRFLDLTISHHEQYLQSPLQLEHACGMLLDSELFSFHSERMCDILAADVQTNTNPHTQFIHYSVLMSFGSRKGEFLRSHKRWRPLIPLLMDHILVDIDSDVEDTFLGMTPGAGPSQGPSAIIVPIEAKLRTLAVRLLYEVCRVQKLSLPDLRIFDDSFIDSLFELVEQTRHMQDDTFNYSVIKLIVALNEQFMVANLGTEHNSHANSKNRVLLVLMRRLGSSTTFGENMIFMLNRARRTPEDLCMQLLVLKILYLLFTTAGTSEYFYTNDLRVLVDVFLRELVDLDEENESLRHTYLRVLHPLLTKTQLRETPYKRSQIVYVLESLMGNSGIRDISPTTRRLVERCLTGEWCVQHRKAHPAKEPEDRSNGRVSTPSSDGIDSSSTSASQTQSQLGITSVHASTHLDKHKTLKSSKSFEFINNMAPSQQTRSIRSPVENTSRSANASTMNLTSIKSALPSAHGISIPKRKDSANSAHVEGAYADRGLYSAKSPISEIGYPSHHHSKPSSPLSGSLSPTYDAQPIVHQQRRSAPPPPKRRKPPAIPVGQSNSGATISTIKSSVISSP